MAHAPSHAPYLQDLDELREFWGLTLGVEQSAIKVQRKSNSNRLTGRTSRSRHGVLQVRVHDTLLRARLQAWIDRLRSEWQIHSDAVGA